MALLDVRSVSVSFGGHLALDEASIQAEAGQVTGLIGPNGAGKTTLFNITCGLQRPDRGEVRIDGTDVTRLSPSRRARRSLARTFQRLELFSMLSVRDNVRVAVETHRGWSGQREPIGPRVDELLERTGLTEVADVRATSVPTGQGRMVEVARALACRPRVLLLDEPAAGQDEEETTRFATLLRSLADDGLAVVLVEHDMRLVLQVCDVLHVLDLGRVLAVGPPEQVRHDEAVLAAYLGTSRAAAS